MAKIPIGSVLLSAAMAFASISGISQENKDAAAAKKGRVLYTQYCVSCHGQEGKGNGPASSALKVRPPDLSTITKRNKTFSQEKVMDQINGEKFVVGHGIREMPVWGKSLRDKEGAQSAAGDVYALAQYLQTLQK